MKLEFDLNADNVGEVDSEGAVVKWPSRDCFGGSVPSVNRTNVTIKRIDATHFAIIPVGKDTGDLEFGWRAAPSAPRPTAKKDAE